MISNVLYWLRASLVSPPGGATADPQRGAIYRAALQQFEELLHAAEATGYAARPLPLFYALAQAGRAIVACRGGEPASRHGLRVRDEDLCSEDPFEWLVSPREDGWFQAVAVATRSPALAQPAPLGALMASLPELSIPMLRGNEYLRALYVEPLPGPDPERLPIDGFRWLRVGIAIDRDAATSPEDVKALLLRYPAAAQAGYRLPPISGGGEYIERWPTAAGDSLCVLLREQSPIGPLRTTRDTLDAIVPQYRWAGRRWLRPALSGAEAPPFALMTWWALLFGLSMLARYHPAKWAVALDRQRSQAATELDRAMDLALAAVPHLVLEAVASHSVLAYLQLLEGICRSPRASEARLCTEARPPVPHLDAGARDFSADGARSRFSQRERRKLLGADQLDPGRGKSRGLMPRE